MASSSIIDEQQSGPAEIDPGYRIETPPALRWSTELMPEVPVAFTYNTTQYAVMMATDHDLTDFAYGFTFSEQIVSDVAEIRGVQTRRNPKGWVVDVRLAPRAFARLRRRRRVAGNTSCGLCGVEALVDAVRAPVTVQKGHPPSSTQIQSVVEQLPQVQRLTARYGGGLHAAVLVGHEGEILSVREDVGRHNALDKLLGASVRSGVRGRWVLMSSRCSYELVQKAAVLGISTLVTLSRATSMAMDMAARCGLNLVTCTGPDGFTIHHRSIAVAERHSS